MDKKMQGVLRLLVLNLRNVCDVYTLYGNDSSKEEDRQTQLTKIIDLGDQIKRIAEKKGE